MAKILSSERGVRWLASAIACMTVAAIASVGQVNSRDDGRDGTVAAGPAETGSATTRARSSDTTPLGGSASTSIPGGAVTTTAGRGGTTGTTSGTTRVGGGTSAPFDYGLHTQGVTASTVKLGISYNVEGCGDSSALTAMLGAGVAGDIPKAIDAFTRAINDSGGIAGRKLQVVVADDGGGGCPEKALAAARELVNDQKVFAVVPGLHEVSDYAASQKVPTFIGRDDPASLERLGANGIGLTQEISGVMKAWSAFGRYYLRSDQHTPCLIHPEAGVSGDWPLYETILDRHMASYGLTFKDTVVYKEDVATAQQQSSAAVVRMRSKGCDQVYFLAGNPLALIFFTNAAQSARWEPQWTFTSYTALADSELAGNLMNQQQWSRAVGLSGRVPPGQHPKEGNCARTYERYYARDGQSDSAAVQLVCAMLLPAAEMMRRGERLTGRLDANALVVGADAVTNDFYFDAHVPIDWRFPAAGPYKTKGWSHYTVVKWNNQKYDYDFPEYPRYWEVMGPDGSNSVDLRPLWQGK